MGKLDQKVALITGASSGIGRGTARAFAREGARVVLAARQAAALEALATEINSSGGEALAVPTDVKVEAQIEALFACTIERFGRLDILVNNAGAFNGGWLEEFTTDDWEHVVAVNLTAPFLCTRAAFRLMKPQGGGRIIFIGSISAQRVRPKSAAYSATKHGLWGLTQVAALEGRPHGIICSCLHPGNVRIERRAASDRPEDQEPMMSIEDLAEAVLFMAAQPPTVNVLEAIVMPPEQLYLGRG